MQKEITLSLSEFRQKIDMIKNSPLSTEGTFTVSPHLEFENIEFNGNKLIVEKTMKPIYTGSPYYEIMGRIESEITETNKGILLNSNFINHNIATLDFIKWFGTAFIVFIFCGLLIFDFSILYFPLMILSELILLVFIKLTKSNSIEGLKKYHNKLIDYIVNQ